ncbi:DUF3789 domain-containing protein, partial [Ruminococcus bicirculans]|nr:DUF3789 domain-containing protein [Ruminococcus bicirculans (ex Wegman et al. 2014)]
MLGFVIGLFVGGTVGVFTMAMCIVAGEADKWFCQYHLTHFIRTRIMQRERYDHSRA